MNVFVSNILRENIIDNLSYEFSISALRSVSSWSLALPHSILSYVFLTHIFSHFRRSSFFSVGKMLSKEMGRPEGAVFLVSLGVGFCALGLPFARQSDESVRASPFGKAYLAHKLKAPAQDADQTKNAHH